MEGDGMSILWSLLLFAAGVSVMGLWFMEIFEEVYSSNKAKVRHLLMMSFTPLTILGIILPSIVRYYFPVSSGPGWTIATSLGSLAVFSFAFGVGCVVILRTYRERLSPGNERSEFNLIIYVLAGIVVPSVLVANSMIVLMGFH